MSDLPGCSFDRECQHYFDIIAGKKERSYKKCFFCITTKGRVNGSD